MSHFKRSTLHPSLLPFGSIEFTFERSTPKLTHRTIEITETKVIQISESDGAFGPVRKKTWLMENDATIEETFA